MCSPHTGCSPALWVSARAAAALALLSFAASSAQAQDLSAADEAFAEGAVQVAAERYEAALESGALRGEPLARAYLRMGMLASWLGDAERSERLLLRALLLRPELETPAEFDPDAQAVFEALRRRADSSPTVVEALRAAGAITVRAEGGSAFGASVRLVDGSGAALVERPFADRLSFDSPDDAVERALLVDEWGNELASAPLRDAEPNAPPVVDPSSETEMPAAPSRVPAIALGIASGAIVAGGVVLLAVGRRDVAAVESAPDGSSYADYRDRADRAGPLTGVGIGAIALGAVGAALSVWLGRRGSNVEVGLGPSGAAVRGRF